MLRRCQAHQLPRQGEQFFATCQTHDPFTGLFQQNHINPKLPASSRSNHLNPQATSMSELSWAYCDTYGLRKRIHVQDKRRQLMNDVRGLCDVHHPSLVQFLGAYRNADRAQVMNLKSNVS